MSSLVQTGKYDTINTIDPEAMGYYVVKYILDAYILQEYTTCDGEISTAGEIVARSQYPSCMKENMKWYWEQTQQQQIIYFLTRTIVHTCLDVFVVKEVQYISISVCNKNQPQQDL